MSMSNVLVQCISIQNVSFNAIPSFNKFYYSSFESSSMGKHIQWYTNQRYNNTKATRKKLYLNNVNYSFLCLDIPSFCFINAFYQWFYFFETFLFVLLHLLVVIALSVLKIYFFLIFLLINIWFDIIIIIKISPGCGEWNKAFLVIKVIFIRSSQKLTFKIYFHQWKS